MLQSDLCGRYFEFTTLICTYRLETNCLLSTGMPLVPNNQGNRLWAGTGFPVRITGGCGYGWSKGMRITFAPLIDIYTLLSGTPKSALLYLVRTGSISDYAFGFLPALIYGLVTMQQSSF